MPRPNDDPRRFLEAERRLAQRIKETLEAAGIDAEDPDYQELLGNECDIERRIIQAARYAKLREAEAEGVKLQIDKLKARKEAHERVAERVKEGILDVLLELDLGRPIKAPDITISLANKLVSVLEAGDADPDRLPDDLVRIKREARKTEIKAALEQGREVPGYSLSNGGKRLNIRV